MRIPLLFATASLALAVATPVIAGDADVCYSPPTSMAADLLTGTTQLKCPRAGNHTLPELARNGWTIVSVAPVIASMANPARPQNEWMVVIQRK